ncbi:hypothetical protein Taro_023134 [Colocasia esculenta]|uniref:Uncharacterized protein n=1 Tax=Colocasia esculenta TaxID=4460 RepID=A0A843V3U6_COLES|nr:hypothetical protein [Colocasia esculenta]
MHLGVCVPLRLRELACGVAFTGAGLLLVELVEGFPRTVLCLFLVAVALPSGLRCIAWLPCVLVRFPRTVCCCSGEGFSEDCSVLVYAVMVLPQGLRYAVVLTGAFWWIFPEWRLGGSGGGSPKTGLRCFYSSTCCSVLSDGPCCLIVWVVRSGEGSSQDRPLSLLVEVLPRTALCSFRAFVVLPLWFEVCHLVGPRSGEVLPRITLCRFWRRFSPKLLRLRWWDCVSPWLGWFASFLTPCVLSQMVVW